jgi:hypothetical protein
MTCIGRSRSVGWVEVYAVRGLDDRRFGGPPQLRRSGFLRWTSMVTELEEVPMSILGGLDIHRKQLTFDWVDELDGKWERGRIAPADRESTWRAG